MMRSITLLDTAVASTNLGDEIIMEAAHQQLAEIFDDAFRYRVASHEWMGGKSRSLIRRSQATIACGTNMLSSRMWFKPLWKVTPLDALGALDVTLMGSGWYQHQSKPDAYTRWLMRKVLSQNTIHSVRDNYSKNMLEMAGIQNVLNTGCPTLWGLTPQACALIPKKRGRHVVTTINTYFRNPELDMQQLRVLQDHYETVNFWIQTETDLDYSKEISRRLNLKLNYLKPSVAAFDEFLLSGSDVDYVGNRLHAGIRAMQHKRRSVIIEVDNRALEMGADFGLPTVKRDDFGRLEAMIGNEISTDIKLPVTEIERWKQQFRSTI